MSEEEMPEEVRIGRSGSLTGVARYIAHRRATTREELRMLFTSQAVRTALCYLKLVDAVYDDGVYIVSVPWLLYLKLTRGDERWITEIRKLIAIPESRRLNALINEVDKVSRTPWAGFIRDALEASKVFKVVEKLSEKVQREFTSSDKCKELTGYVSWLITIYASTIMHITSLEKMSRRHLHVSLKRQLKSLAKTACVGGEDMFCSTVKTLLEVVEMAGSYLKEDYISTFAMVREYYDTRLYRLSEQTRRNAYSTILSFAKSTVAEILADRYTAR